MLLLFTVFRFYVSEKRRQVLRYAKTRTTQELAEICCIHENELELIGGRFRNKVFMAETRALYRIHSQNWNKDLFRYIDSDSYKHQHLQMVSEAYNVYIKQPLDTKEKYDLYMLQSHYGLIVIYETKTNTLLYLNRGL